MKAKTKNIRTSTPKVSGIGTERIAVWERKYFFECLVFAFSFLLFANSILGDYNMDDELVTINHRLTSKGIAAIPEIFTSPYYQDDAGYSYEYRPVVLASFAIEHDVFGENPHWSHFWNVLLYSLTCLLLYRVLRLLFDDYSPLLPIAVSLLFVAHPAHTEVVCSIKNRDEILGLMFSLLSFYIILKSFSLKKHYLLLLAPLFMLFALMSKITVVSFVFIIPLALMLFKKANIQEVIKSLFLLLTPAIFIVPIGSTFEKIIFLIGNVVGLFALYSLLHYKSVFTRAKEMLQNAYNKYFIQKTEEEPKVQEQPLALLGSVIPGKAVLLSPFSIVTPILTALYIYTFNGSYFIYTISIPVLFGVLMWRGNDKVKWWSAIGLYLCIYIGFDFYKGRFENVYRDALISFLFYQLFYGNRSMLLPVLFAFLVFINHCLVTHNYSDIPLNVLLFLLISFKSIRFLILALLIAIQLYFSKDIVLAQPDTYFNAGVLFSIITVIIYHFREKPKSQIALWAMPVIAMSIFAYFSIQQKPIESLSKNMNEMISTTNKINVRLVDNKQNRPLNFAEQCVGPNDPVTVQVGTSLSILSFYLQKVIVPYPLSFYYGYSFIHLQKVSELRPILSLLAYLFLSLLVLILIRKTPLISYGLMVYLFSVAVFSNYISYVPGMLADRFLLVPSLGWSLVVVGLWGLFFQVDFSANGKHFKALSSYSRFSLFALLTLYSLMSFSRNSDWRNYLTLARHDIKYVENSAQAHNLLGLRLMKESYTVSGGEEQQQMQLEALTHFKRAIDIYPAFFNATYDIGRVYSILNQTDSAIVYYQKTLHLDSTFTNANLALGEIYFQQQRLDDARINFEKLIAAFPTNSVGYDKVSYIYFLQKEYSKSIAVNKVAMENMPSDPQPCIAIAKAFYTMQQFDSSRVYLKKALQLNPSQQEANALLQNLNSR